jgi:hypothetical protein
VHLTEDEHLVLFRLCNFHAEAYRKTNNIKFWTVITAKFQKETGKNHSSLRRVINVRCNKRRADVAAEGSGETQNNSERTIQEDAWIEVIDEDNRILADRKDRAAGVIGESIAAENARSVMMHSQAERGRAQSDIIQPRSRIPARKAKQTSGLITDEEDISTEVEDEEGEDTGSKNNSAEESRNEDAGADTSNKEITISDDDNPFDLIKISKKPTVPSCKTSNSQGRNRKRQRINLLPPTDDGQDRLEASFVILAEAVTKSITPAAKEKGDEEALEQRLTAVIEKRLGSLEQNQLAIMTMLQQALKQPQSQQETERV